MSLVFSLVYHEYSWHIMIYIYIYNIYIQSLIFSLDVTVSWTIDVLFSLISLEVGETSTKLCQGLDPDPGTRMGVESTKNKQLPSGELTKSYGKWPFIVDFPIKNGDFPWQNVKLPEATLQCGNGLRWWAWWSFWCMTKQWCGFSSQR